MEKILMLYSSREGQTLKILQHIQKRLEPQCKCELVDLHQQPSVDWQQYNKVLIGASIRYGNFHSSLYRFIKAHQQQLELRPSAFFCTNLTARKPEKNTPDTNAYMRKFVKHSPWQPDLMGVFAGALLYSRYTWWQTAIIQLIMKITGGSTDKSKDIEFTDWQKVTEFALQVDKLGKTA